MLLQLSDVSKAYGSQTVLRNVTFQINPTEKIGLIGTNGSGKTTLLRILAGKLEPDGGIVSRRTSLQVGTLDQIPDFHENTTVFDEAVRSFAQLLSIEDEMRSLEAEIERTGRKDLLDRYAELQHAFEIQGGYRFRAMTEAALLGIGFPKALLDRPSRLLSGGEKNRLALAKLLLSESDLLLLDEPTNHLDLRSIEWLEGFLKDTPKTIIVVSHDRIFLDRVVDRILEIDGARMSDYHGNYSYYVQESAERRARQQKEFDQQQAWIADQEDYIRRNIAGQKTKQAQSRRKLLAKVERIERPGASGAAVKFQFLPSSKTARGSRHVVSARDLSVGYTTPLIKRLQLDIEREQRWAILGANGSGKTTLLRTLTGGLQPLDGELEWGEKLEVGYYDQQLADLDAGSSVLDEIRQLNPVTTDGGLRSYLARFLFSGDDVYKKIGSLSGGEKSRVALAKIIYEEPSILALDEPTNHLDIASREALEGALTHYPGTILFVTHDRYLAQKIATHLLYVEDGEAYGFDRLSAFETWLNERPAAAKAEKAEKASQSAPAAHISAGMSKNRREKLEGEAAELERRIGGLEEEIRALESAFANPAPGMNWEEAHRKHAEARLLLDSLYRDLEERWELMG